MTTESTSPRRFQFSLSTLLAAVIFCGGQLTANTLSASRYHPNPNSPLPILFIALSSIVSCFFLLIASRGKSQLRCLMYFLIAFFVLMPVNLFASLILQPSRYDCGCSTSAIWTCKSYSTAQNIYRRSNVANNEIPSYALFIEELYESKPGASDIVLIDRVFRSAESSRPSATPKCGYLFKVLTSQGVHAKGGVGSYLCDGKMLNGYALVAFPANYNDLGLKSTFIVNHEELVYEADLGPDTTKIAEAMTAFDPDPKIWTLAE